MLLKGLWGSICQSNIQFGRDGPLALICYEEVERILSAIYTQNIPKFSILGVDPTFNLGDFDVTVKRFHP